MFARRKPGQVVLDLMQAQLARECVRLALLSPGQSLFLTAMAPGVVDVRRRGQPGREVSHQLTLRLLKSLPDGAGPLTVHAAVERAAAGSRLRAYPLCLTARLQVGDPVHDGRVVGLRMTTRDPASSDTDLDSVSRSEIDRDGDIVVVSVEDGHGQVTRRPASHRDLPYPNGYTDGMRHLRRFLGQVTADLSKERNALGFDADAHAEAFVGLHRMRTALVRLLERMPACTTEADRDERTTLRMRARDIGRSLSGDGLPPVAGAILADEDKGIAARLREIRADARAARELDRRPTP